MQEVADRFDPGKKMHVEARVRWTIRYLTETALEERSEDAT
jgi:hypothetical protein